MKIESSTTLVELSIAEVFEKLSKASTFERLMPEEASFRLVDEERFSFKLGSMPAIALKVERLFPNSQIILVADGGNVPFELQVNLTEFNSITQIQLVFDGNLNPMMQMMVKRPLTQFLEALIGNAKKL